MRFPVSIITHLFSYASDHLPLILQTGTFKRVAARSARAFKFEESWLLWDECESVVQDACNKFDNGNLGLNMIKDKIANYGMDLHAWGSTEHTQILKKSSKSKRKLKQSVLAS